MNVDQTHVRTEERALRTGIPFCVTVTWPHLLDLPAMKVSWLEFGILGKKNYISLQLSLSAVWLDFYFCYQLSLFRVSLISHSFQCLPSAIFLKNSDVWCSKLPCKPKKTCLCIICKDKFALQMLQLNSVWSRGIWEQCNKLNRSLEGMLWTSS